jgi:hypothetical protein
MSPQDGDPSLLVCSASVASSCVLSITLLGERPLHFHLNRNTKPILSPTEQQRIIAMACSDAPDGRARWTVRLIAEQAVKRKLVPKVGRETIRILLESHDLKPWREKNVVRGRTQ